MEYDSEPEERRRSRKRTEKKKRKKVTEEQGGDDSDEESGSSSIKDKIANASGQQRMLVISTVIVVGIFGFAYYMKHYRKSDSEKEGSKEESAEEDNKRVRWADEVGEDLEQVHEFNVQEQRMELARNMEDVLKQIDGVNEAINKNKGQTKQNSKNMTSMFGDDSSGYDDEQSAMETEQNFATAFMMKTDLDNRRKGMATYSGKLHQQLDGLMNKGKELMATYNRMQQEYLSRYNTAYVPARKVREAEMRKQQFLNGMAPQRNPNPPPQRPALPPMLPPGPDGNRPLPPPPNHAPPGVPGMRQIPAGAPPLPQQGPPPGYGALPIGTQEPIPFTPNPNNRPPIPQPPPNMMMPNIHPQSSAIPMYGS